MRRLNELEQMDAAQEQMEELKKMKARGRWWPSHQPLGSMINHHISGGIPWCQQKTSIGDGLLLGLPHCHGGMFENEAV